MAEQGVPPRYPSTGTCDLCATGETPIRTEHDAYICERCDYDHERAVLAGAQAGGVDFASAEIIVDAYLRGVNVVPDPS